MNVRFPSESCFFRRSPEPRRTSATHAPASLGFQGGAEWLPEKLLNVAPALALPLECSFESGAVGKNGSWMSFVEIVQQNTNRLPTSGQIAPTPLIQRELGIRHT